MPPLITWLADRIDDLAGMAGQPRALTFGDLWLGPDSAGRPDDDGFRTFSRESGHRVTNLALMTIALGMSGPSCTGCRPWDLPVVLAARMSMPLPGLICPVPLFRQGKPHWFSDGGITGNFPFHFFDSLLPRWPTFGLNLDALDKKINKDEEVLLPKQDDSTVDGPWVNVGDGASAFASRILDTFPGWRDTMQCALPGFRGRIANVRQGHGEGGMNLSMTPEVIATLAMRGHKAGEELKRRFTTQDGGEAAGFTQTDRYRWIRMRLALREYRELTRQAKARAPLYQAHTATYEIPRELAGWFPDQRGAWPRAEPYSVLIEATFDWLGQLAET